MDPPDEKEWEYKTTLVSRICTNCRHIDEDITKRTCRAFPEGIPKQIWMGEKLHRRPCPGDHGIQYEKSTNR